MKTLYIIDGHALIYSGYYAPMRSNLTSPSGVPTKATYIFTNTLLGLLSKRKPDMLVVTMDSKADSFRKEIYPDYKAHRPPMPEDMPVQIDNIVAILDAMRIPVLRMDGFEADDIIGTLSDMGSKAGYEVFICSRDKDMLQLLEDGVVTYDIKNDAVYDRDWLAKEMGVTPEQFVDVLALQGDKADNVPGVPDVGPKTALEWIKEYGSIDGVYENIDMIKGKRGDALRANKDLAYLSKKLVVINREVPIEVDEDNFKVHEFDEGRLKKIFEELGFEKLLDQLGLRSKSGGQMDLFGGSGEAVAAVSSGELKDITSVPHRYELIDTQEALDEFVSLLSKQKIFAIDTETTSIRPMEADLVGINISWKAHEAYYLPVCGPLGEKVLGLDAVRTKLSEILEDESVVKVGQNLKYDLLVLENAGFKVNGAKFDTMIASYLLNSERSSNSMDEMAKDYLGYNCISIKELIGTGKKQITFDQVETKTACDYACEDADITWQLYEYLNKRLGAHEELVKLFDEIEIPLMRVLATMERNGVRLDVGILKRMSQKVSEKIDIIQGRIFQLCGVTFNIDSPKQLSEVLFDDLGLPEVKKRSTDISVLEELRGSHEVIDEIIEYRQLSKLKSTYLDKLGGMINSRTHRLHASFNQTVAATGRLSSSDPNLQNIPIRTEIGREIRSAFVPADNDHHILSADYSQVELRILAHISGDQGLRDAFNNDMDVHSFVASQIFGVDISEVTSDMRAKCKAVNFGVIYGQGAFGLSKTIGISQREAKRFIDDYFHRYSSIKQCMEDIIEKAQKDGYAQTILGRRRPIAGLKSKNFNIKSQAQRMAFNTVIQGSAADLIKKAMISIQQKIEQESLPIKMVLQIHDELVFEVPKNNIKEYAKWIGNEMSSAIQLDVPLKVDVGYGESWLAGH